VTALVTAYHSRRAAGPMPTASMRDGLEEALHLFKIGGAFLLSAVLMVLGAYLVRRTVRDGHGLHAAGLYQAAWTLGGTYVGFVLQAMGTDFYPRLTSTLGDDAACNAMVNEQAHVSILLAGPGVAATFALAPAVLAIFYDTTFHGAIEPLRWMTLGMFLRVVSWPMGFIILARGATMMFIIAETAAFAVHVGLALWLTPSYGVTGAAAAFAGLYAWHACFVYAIVRRMTGFRWSATTWHSAAVVLALIVTAFVSNHVLSGWWPLAVQLTAACLVAVFSLRQIGSVLSTDALPALFRRAGKVREATGAP
jgi:enterobacterial common antigen flippase